MSTAEMPGAAADLLTFEDFCAIVPDGQKADLLNAYTCLQELLADA